MKVSVKTIHGTDYEFISDVDALYEMKRDCLVRKDEDDIFYCFKNGTIKRLSMMDGGFACSKKEFMSFDIIEYHNIETTVVYLKNMTIEEYIEEYIGEEIGVEENLSQISAENLKIAKVSYSNRYLSLVSNDEGYFAVKEAMKNTCTTLSEVEQILDGKEMLVSELISKLESKLQDYDVIETVETVVEFVAKNYDEEQDGNFERKEYKKVKKTLVKKVAKIEVKEEIKIEEIKENNEQKEVAYHNENNEWYLINDCYKDTETIEEEGIDLNNYKIVKIESDECDIDYGFDSMNGVAKCYTWSCQDGNWYLEEEGCFTKFNSCQKLEEFVNGYDYFEDGDEE